MRPELVLAEDLTRFTRLAGERIAKEIEKAVAERGHSSVAFSGGETPKPVYGFLARPEMAERVAWPAVEVYFSDERCVPPGDPASNYRMVRESLLRDGTVRPARVHRIEGDGPDRERAAADYGERLPARLDLLLLGMGTDGHIASLFPGSRALNETDRRAVPIVGGEPPIWRITITPPVIAKARSVLVLVAGGGKAEMVARAIEGPYDPMSVPAQLVRGRTWILDRAAASVLREKWR